MVCLYGLPEGIQAQPRPLAGEIQREAGAGFGHSSPHSHMTLAGSRTPSSARYLPRLSHSKRFASVVRAPYIISVVKADALVAVRTGAGGSIAETAAAAVPR